MRVYDVIKKKRDGGELSASEIKTLIEGYVKGDIPDYQMSAFLMAVYFRGMTAAETTALTLAMTESGEKPDFSAVNGFRADKHSTGGVGDKTSLIVAPIAASLGVKVAKISGRGLGHTGGTVDKLESIPGFNAGLGKSDFIAAVNEVGVSITGQTADVAPADKKIYALRDVTATIDSIPLIASSIMSKKLAADDDAIVLDVKVGSGAFMKREKDAVGLARAMVDVGKAAGKKISAFITDMDKPLGNAVGNSLEVVEAIETLKGRGPKDLEDLSTALAAEMLYLSGYGEVDFCRKAAYNSIKDGSALKTFAAMVKRQGGDVGCVDDYGKFGSARFFGEIKAPIDGYISKVNAEAYGTAACILGAGRNKISDKINPRAGIVLSKKTGNRVFAGETCAVLYADDDGVIDAAKRLIAEATAFSSERPKPRPLIKEIIR